MSLTLLPPVKKKPKPDYLSLYLNAWQRAVDDTHKSIFYGVKVMNRMNRGKIDPRDTEAYYSIYSSIIHHIGELTPRQLTRMFPVQKVYDGAKWQSKDYFYTMKKLEAHGMDEPIGDAAFRLLWDYMNHDLCDFTVGFTDVLDNIRRAQGEKGMLESFFESQGQHLTTYSRIEQDGKEYMRNNDTGEIMKVTKPKPRYLRVLREEAK